MAVPPLPNRGEAKSWGVWIINHLGVLAGFVLSAVMIHKHPPCVLEKSDSDSDSGINMQLSRPKFSAISDERQLTILTCMSLLSYGLDFHFASQNSSLK